VLEREQEAGAEHEAGDRRDLDPLHGRGSSS
jgi:hypothetical protein